ncbi:hypothetical protein MMC29_006295 [Sticta canariensis]|nr:hypothetical protein [Sticta canariensis]
MAAKKLFITGATGFIGGSVLENIVKNHPELQVSALLRSTPEGFVERYPSVSIITGTFNHYPIIQDAAYDADIVIHAGDIEHEVCARAIIAGLTTKETPGFLIHLSGTGSVYDRMRNRWEGLSNPKVWSDLDDIDEIYNLPDTAMQHSIDRLIQYVSNDLLKTAIICPPDIYGQSHGISNRTSLMIPLYVEGLLKGQEPFYLGRGENLRAVVHIDDVVDLFAMLLQEALDGGGIAEWGLQGFYFASSDEVVWKDVAEAITQLGREQKWLPPDTQPVSYSAEQLRAVSPLSPDLAFSIYGSNSRVSSDRARLLLNWRPNGPAFWTTLPRDVEDSVARYRKKLGA